MNRRAIGALLVLSLSANLATLGTLALHRLRADPVAPCAHGACADHLSLALSPQQEADFQRLRGELSVTRASCHERVTGLRAELVAELVAERPDPARIEELLEGMGAQQIDLQRRIVRHLLDVRALLRPEQLPAFEELLRCRMSDPTACPYSGAGGGLGEAHHEPTPTQDRSHP